MRLLFCKGAGLSKKSNEQDTLRKAAESQLARASKPRPQPAEKLQVHQIEQDIQNETLRQSQIALEASRGRFVDLYEFAPIGYLNFTRESIIAEENLIGAALLGMARNKLLQHRFDHFVRSEEQ